MDAVVSNALISAGANVASAGGGILAQAAFGKRNNRWAKEAATTAYNRAVEQWNRENAYNTPKAQMQRFIDAGLNPSLIYGMMSGGSIGLPSVPQASTNQSIPSPIPQGMFDALYQSKLMESQIRKNDADVVNQTKMTDGQIERWAHENNVSDQMAKLYIQQASNVAEQTRNLAKEWILMDKDEQLKNYEIQIKRDTWQDVERKIAADANISVAEAKFATRYFLARLLYVQAGRDDLLASAELKRSQKSLTDEQTRQLSRTMDDLVAIISNNKTESDAAAKIAQFMAGHTNNWEYWLNKGLQEFHALSNDFSSGLKAFSSFVPAP